MQARLRALGRAWQRFEQAVRQLRDQGWPVLDEPRRWRLGELSVGWDAVRAAA